MHFAMMGTRGVPAQYGGFETAVEEVGARLAGRGHRVTVYCRNAGQSLTTYKGMSLVNLPAFRRRSLETLSHTGLSALHVWRHRPDSVILFNVANSLFLPALSMAGVPVAVHTDGLEWKRAKWQGVGSRYYKHAETFAARRAPALIADARGIADYLLAEYGRQSFFIPYGAPIIRPGAQLIESLGVRAQAYHLIVARVEPENNIEMILRGFIAARSEFPLLVVGSAPYQDKYIDRLKGLAKAGNSNCRFLGAVWDQELLDQLYANSISYLHGHSVGGTNPSLLRALGSGAPVTAFDVNFNREVSGGHARFFSSAHEVRECIEADEDDLRSARSRGEAGRLHVKCAYRWDDVADQYELLLTALAEGRA